MGHGAVYDLIYNSPDVESVTVADFDLKKAEEVAEAVGTGRVTAHHIDVSNYSDVVEFDEKSRFGNFVRQLLV